MDKDKKQQDIPTELKNALEQAEVNLKGWQRAAADFENYKRRDQHYHAELLAFGEEKVIAKILEILEDLDRVLNHTPEDLKDLSEWRKGAGGVRKRLHDTLHDLGVEKVETAGAAFNPDEHEALMQVEGEEDNIIAEEISPGYKRGKRLLKPAGVKVYKKISKS